MKNGRVTIGSIRRGEIVDAAWAVIAQKGLDRLSLSEIEKKVGMSRGQLTYYFRTKEAILLAVFDRLLEKCRQRGKLGGGNPNNPAETPAWEECLSMVLRLVLSEREKNPQLHALHHTFLAQIGHRGDFRRRLAKLYAEGRERMALQLRRSQRHRKPARKVSLAAFTAVVQALVHGLAVQAAVAPGALNADDVRTLCMDMLLNYLWPQPGKRPSRLAGFSRNGSRNGRLHGSKVKSNTR